MADNTITQLARLPVRDRVAAALEAAERATRALHPQPELLRLASPALAEARRWQAGHPVPARRLYEYIHPLTERGAENELAGREQAALFAVVYALYYATWHARREEGAIGPPLPNDICEITEQTLADCLAYAAQAECSSVEDR